MKIHDKHKAMQEFNKLCEKKGLSGYARNLMYVGFMFGWSARCNEGNWQKEKPLEKPLEKSNEK